MGSGGLVVMDENTCMVEVARFFMSFTQRESCGKCVPCREGTKRMLEILERIVDGKGKMSDLDELEELATMVQSMALCGLGKSAPLPVISTLKRFRDEYEEHIRDKNVVQRFVQPFASSTLMKSSVSDAASAPRTVRPEQSPERSSIRIILIMTAASSAVHVRITVTLMQFMWKRRREERLWVQ